MKTVYKGNEIEETIPAIENDDEIITTDKEKADIFNNFFCSITRLDTSNASLPDSNRLSDFGNLNEINITQADVRDQIMILDLNKSYGPDKISPKFLKEGINQLTPVLTHIFNLSLKTSTFPAIWKQANVVPLFKKGIKSDVNNYRPVSLLSIVARVFERIMFKYLYNHLKENFVISSNQSGFLPGKSTVTQLVEVYYHLCNAIENHKEVCVVFLDIAKAFDKVWHEGIIYKLEQCGISGKLLDWFKCYLENRKQRVVLNGQCSEWGRIESGVPQGSVLGPLLFLIYINDVSNAIVHCQIRLFADDTCLFIEVDDREREAEYA